MKSGLKMKISDLVERSGIPRSTIQYYLREGLLHPPDKTGRTMAYYDEIHLRLLKEIHRIKMTQLKKTKGSRVPIEAIKSRLYQERNGKSPIKSGKRLLKDKKSPGENKRQKILEAATRPSGSSSGRCAARPTSGGSEADNFDRDRRRSVCGQGLRGNDDG